MYYVQSLLNENITVFSPSSVYVPIQNVNVTCKGPVKLIQPVKIANSFLQSVSDLFNFLILSLPM